MMLKSVEGVYRSGRIELSDMPNDLWDEMPVIVTFLEKRGVDLRSRGIDETQALILRNRMAAFAEDWDSPEMDIYDDYDQA